MLARTAHRTGLRIGTVAVVTLLAGCANIPAQDLAGITGRIEQSTGAVPQTGAPDSEIRSQRVAELLAEPVTPEIAARIAVSGHPRVAAAFAQLGIDRAGVVAGALPANPTLSLARLVPEHDGPDVLKQAFGIDLLSLLTLPARRGAARAGWEAAKARAVGETLLVAGAARAAMIDHIGAAQQLDLMRQANEASQAALAAAEAIHAAGNSARVELDRERLFAAGVALDLRRAEAAFAVSREEVSAALGLTGEQASTWTAARRLPAPPSDAIARSDIEAAVLSASTDKAQAVAVLEASRILARSTSLTSWLPGLELDGERERDGDWKQGLGIGAVLPLFGFGAPDRQRADSVRALAEAEAEAIDLELRSEARARLIQAEAARSIALDHRETLLPLSQAVFEGVQLDFNAMQVGIFQLLEAKRARLETGRAAIEATRLYWQAQAGLDLLLAGAGPGGSAVMAMPAGGGAAKPDPGH